MTKTFARILAVTLSLAMIGAAHHALANAGTKAEGQSKKPPKEAKDAPKPKKEAPKTDKKEGGPVGYGDSVIQLQPMMIPTFSSTGASYQPVTMRISLAPGENERPECYM